MHKGDLYVISAPSGTGKTSLVSALVKRLDNVEVAISYTTRQQRPAEVNGENYFFTDEATFQKMINTGDFLEYASVYGNYYGTSKSWVAERLSSGRDIILEIDWQGAQQIKRLVKDARGIFIIPPSLAELKNRLDHRGQDSQEIIAARMAKAQEEISHYAEFEYLVVNDSFAEALADLLAIFRSRRLEMASQSERQHDLLNELIRK